jgi:NAD(P)H-hydrate epimerase
MRTADAAAVAERGEDSLVHEAGTAIGFAAKSMLASCYGSKVAVIVGPGLNGADGRVAARWLKGRGARVDLVEVSSQPAELRGYDLVIDAAFGLGCSRPYDAPTVTKGTKVLAVDLPSGVDADTGVILGAPLKADVTMAIGALKYAHITGAASHLTGELRVASLGIVSAFDDGLVEDGDLDSLVHMRQDDHKWKHAVSALCGSTLMPGAAELVVRAAIAAGASMVRLTSRGDVATQVRIPPEAVHTQDETVDARCRAVVAGPGLGGGAGEWLRARLAATTVPVVLDADGLDLSLVPTDFTTENRWILTPHEGEFVRVTGVALEQNRVAACRALAHHTGCVVLLKGPTTLIASPSGTLRVVTSGTPALATAGSGDVLSGLIAGAIARGHDALTAGALSAHLHGRIGGRLGVYSPASSIIDGVSGFLGEIVAKPQ